MARIHEFKIPTKEKERGLANSDFLRLSRDLKNLLENPIVIASPALSNSIGDAVTDAGKMWRNFMNAERKKQPE